MSRIATTNPQQRGINQGAGPRVGNSNPGSKRADFQDQKSRTGSQRSELADMVTAAIAARGQGMRGYRDATVEPVAARVNTGRGPTRGNAARRSGAARRGALGATSGY